MPHGYQRKLDRREKSIHGHQSEQSEESQPNQINKVLRRPILAASASRPKGHCASACASVRTWVLVGQPLLAVPGILSSAKADSQEWLSWHFIKRLFRFSRVH
jgi:hypothetical protein